jgi:uncharacterized protein (UPF0216 family)
VSDDLERYVAGELRVLNAHLPSRQKRLADLLAEPEPFVACRDDVPHLFKRDELARLAGLLTPEEQRQLVLPMLIEVGGTREGETALRCPGAVEEKVASRVLGMPLACRDGRILLYKPQLAKLRGELATTTQYVFLTGPG